MRIVLACSLVLIGAAAAFEDDKDKEPVTDEKFAVKASEGGMAEVNMGRLAAKRASNADVKEFGEKMVKDHTRVNKELMSLANKKGLKLARSMDEKHKKMFDKLGKLEGAEFDREYMATMVKGHEEMVKLFEGQGKSGKDDDLKQFAEKTLPGVKMHLKMAKDINGKLKKGGE